MQGDLIDSNVLFKSVIYSDEPSNIEMLRRENYVYVPKLEDQFYIIQIQINHHKIK